MRSEWVGVLAPRTWIAVICRFQKPGLLLSKEIKSFTPSRVPLDRWSVALMGTKRLLWIVNHRTLMPAEVPLLESLGYEVFVPKLIPRPSLYRSGVVDYRYDEKLTIRRSALNVLNSHPFYERKWSETLSEIINENFETLITSISVFKQPMIEAVNRFSGRVVVRAFGREEPYTYEDYFDETDAVGLREKISDLGDRFVFCQAFDNLNLVESDWLKKRAWTVLASIPNWMWAHRQIWQPNDPRVLFLCPDIMTTSHFKRIYDEFKKEFDVVPHWIFGKQDSEVADNCVLGSLSDADLFDLYGRVSAYIYTSKETRHLHYSPVEAMIVGTPVLFFKGSMLHHLGGDRQSGMCSDFGEMRAKALGLVGGDQALADEIRADQETILQTFSPELARKQWIDLFNHTPSHQRKLSRESVGSRDDFS